MMVWNVVFNREAASGWARFVPGRYKHVRAYAYLPDSRIWLFYDVSFAGTEISAIPHGPASYAKIYEFIGPEGASDIVSMKQLPGRPRRLPWSNLCTAALRHLLHVPGHTLRPDGFHRDCLASGGVPFEAMHGSAEISATADGPGSDRGQSACRAG